MVVVAGKGNNGADGRVAAERLRRRGARVDVVGRGRCTRTARRAPFSLDLVIDAAYGTGFRGTYKAPSVPAGVQVLAVDIPSGIDGDTGEVSGEVLRADLTVTFGALKPGLLQGDGPALLGSAWRWRTSASTPSRARMWLVEDADVSRLVPARSREANKWQSGVVVVAGSPGMLGAASLCSKSAYRAGAGMVRLAVPGESGDELPATEAVAFEVPRHGWAPAVLEVAERCRAVVIGPGHRTRRRDALPMCAGSQRSPPCRSWSTPTACSRSGDSGEVLDVAKSRKAGSGPIVLTPHAGEFAQIFGRPPGIDKVTETLAASRSTGCIFLLKGSTTVVARATPAMHGWSCQVGRISPQQGPETCFRVQSVHSSREGPNPWKPPRLRRTCTGGPRRSGRPKASWPATSPICSPNGSPCSGPGSSTRAASRPRHR